MGMKTIKSKAKQASAIELAEVLADFFRDEGYEAEVSTNSVMLTHFNSPFGAILNLWPPDLPTNEGQYLSIVVRYDGEIYFPYPSFSKDVEELLKRKGLIE